MRTQNGDPKRAGFSHSFLLFFLFIAGDSHAKRTIGIVSGGFATVQPNSVLSINAVEGYPLEDFSADAVRSQIAEAQKVAGGSGSEQDIAEAKIELEVRETARRLTDKRFAAITNRTQVLESLQAVLK